MILRKLLIAGSRVIPEDRLDVLDKTLLDWPPFDIGEIVSGRAEGADRLGENWAFLHGYPIIPFKPKYKEYKPEIAPLKRNEEMAIYSNLGIIIIDCQLWNKSRGTLNMMSHMENYNKPYALVGFDRTNGKFRYVPYVERKQLLEEYIGTLR